MGFPSASRTSSMSSIGRPRRGRGCGPRASPGAMPRWVRDLAILLQVIAGPDLGDPWCADRPVPDYTAALEKRQPPRLGRVRGLFHDLAEPPVRTLMDQITDRLRSRGAPVAAV